MCASLIFSAKVNSLLGSGVIGSTDLACGASGVVFGVLIGGTALKRLSNASSLAKSLTDACSAGVVGWTGSICA